MKYLVAGLGNIGLPYKNTRHNIGFIVLDALLGASNTFFSEEKMGSVARYRLKNKQVVLLKPNTYMNLSGKAVQYMLRQENITLENLLVVTDDLALPEGKIRLKGKGSAGGHNGIQNIIDELQTQNFARLRFGIGSEYHKGKQVDYVLSPWTSQELTKLEDRIILSMQCIDSFILSGLATAMNQFNGQ